MAHQGEIINIEDNPVLFSTRYLNILSNPFETKNVRKNNPEEISDLEEKGWAQLKVNPKSIQMGLKKNHSTYLEERVWSLLARMGYEQLGELRNFHIQYKGDLTQQIDVLAADSETILICECTSAKNRTRKNLREKIRALESIMNDLRTAVQKTFPGKQKVGFLFITNNIILSKSQLEMLQHAKITHLNQDSLTYFEELSKHLGSGAKYQLVGKLFENMKIPEMKNRVPAVSGTIGGKRYYAFSIEPDILLKMCYVFHRMDTSHDALMAYQRLVKKKRVKDIAEFIEGGGYFPNSLVISLNVRRVKFEKARLAKHDSAAIAGILHLPKVYRSAWIIDGQHRLYGYSHTDLGTKRTVPVVAFLNLSSEEQAQLFIDINHKQQGVTRNLLNTIMAEFNWNSDNNLAALQSLRTKVIESLNNTESSPLYKKVTTSEEPSDNQKCLTLESLKAWGLMRTDFFGEFTKDEIVTTGTLWNGDWEKTRTKVRDFLIECFSYVEEELPEMWNAGRGPGGFISMNIGISSLIVLINDLLNLQISEGVRTHTKEAEELAKGIKPYLEPAIKWIQENTEIVGQLRGEFGGGAVSRVVKYLQDPINKRFSTYNPEGLDEWRETMSGQYTELSSDLGYLLEKKLFDFLNKKLKEIHGRAEKDWWYKGIPPSVSSSAVQTKNNEQSTKHAYNFLYLINVKEIILFRANKEHLLPIFTPPGKERENQEAKVSWIVKFNDIRKLYSHPKRSDVSKEQYEFLESTAEWVRERIS